MNERIRELAEQARDYVADAIELGFPQDQIDDIRDEKFAELIVKECLNICRECIKDGYDEAEEPRGRIKDRFGVEE